MTPKQRKLARIAEKQVKQAEKSARLAANVIVKSPFVKIGIKPDIRKITLNPNQFDYKMTLFEWCCTHGDTIGRWSWREKRAWSNEEFSDIISLKLTSLTTLPWAEVETLTYNGSGGARRFLNKYQPLDSICDEAQLRWLENDNLNQFEELFRLRLGGNRRIWGVRVQHHFFMVWYERNHKICPIRDRN